MSHDRDTMKFERAGGPMKSTAKVSVQKVGGGTFRVNAKSGRSAITGRYVTKATADGHPKSTTSETPKR
jgi:hypothetical protein